MASDLGLYCLPTTLFYGFPGKNGFTTGDMSFVHEMFLKFDCRWDRIGNALFHTVYLKGLTDPYKPTAIGACKIATPVDELLVSVEGPECRYLRSGKSPTN